MCRSRQGRRCATRVCLVTAMLPPDGIRPFLWRKEEAKGRGLHLSLFRFEPWSLDFRWIAP